MKRLFKNRFRTKIKKKSDGYVIKYTNLFGFFYITLDKCFIDGEGLPYMSEWIFKTEEEATDQLVHFKTMKDIGRHWNTEITFFAETEKK